MFVDHSVIALMASNQKNTLQVVTAHFMKVVATFVAPVSLSTATHIATVGLTMAKTFVSTVLARDRNNFRKRCAQCANLCVIRCAPC